MRKLVIHTIPIIITAFLMAGMIFPKEVSAVTVTITSNNPRDNNTSTGFNDQDTSAVGNTGQEGEATGDDTATDATADSSTDTVSDTSSDTASDTVTDSSSSENSASDTASAEDSGQSTVSGTDQTGTGNAAAETSVSADTQAVVPRTGEDNRIYVISAMLLISLTICVLAVINSIRNRS